MTDIRNIKLEILRPGPAHNQLLSPLTQYLALCGADGPVTINQPFEQRQLLTRLNRLRYFIGTNQVAPEQREAELRAIGESMGDIFGQIPALLSELGSARSTWDKLVHLRLSLSAFELGLMPFETAISPDGFPSSGSPLFLQKTLPIVLTREVRRGRPLPVSWDRPPRILFIYASPDGLAEVPAKQHLVAIRRAISPWVTIVDSDDDKLKEVKKIITVLSNATLEQVRHACVETEFTHIHVLAHGASYQNAGERRYGLALCSSKSSSEMDVVDGERLAIAITADREASCDSRNRPTVLSLATCDSANTNSVLTPGGSIAHELHAAGIPWVFASQFPLYMRASNIFTEVLYKRLLRGHDPRCVLYELRQRLRTSCPDTHDWASIVAYATVPWNFENQVESFRDKQIRNRIEIKFARIDHLLEHSEAGEADVETANEMVKLCSDIRQDLKDWRNTSSALTTIQDQSERLGVSAASEKRIGIALQNFKLEDDDSDTATKVLTAYENSRRFYWEALEADITNHWAITQYLSMLVVTQNQAISEVSGLELKYREWWVAARQMSKWQLASAKEKDKVWGYGTLAELELLGVFFSPDTFNMKKAKEEIGRYCRKIVNICGPDTFPVKSTKRQFCRYADTWKIAQCRALAKVAVDALESNEPWEI
ncbi:CHAT domain-containing protein [Desulfosediminicola flagellatus]|uniref:CHAT domain-containing protein n=1 Tax=Desulfosediminicola flagellatus TaxID=2569541 RepID=UPI0010AB7319|nr:CHAT domain-containing protein [Desulfosediminicola flagellatus]